MSGPTFSQRRILEAMLHHEASTAPQLQAAAGWPKNGFRRTMKLLVDKGWVAVVEADKAWRLTPEGQQALGEPS